MSTGTLSLRAPLITPAGKPVELSSQVVYVVCDHEDCRAHLTSPGVISDDRLFEVARRAGWTSDRGPAEPAAEHHYCAAHPRGARS